MRSALYQGAMDEAQRERDPESYFGAGIGGGSGLFTAGGTSDGPHFPAPAAPSVATVTEPAREIPVHEETDVLVVGGGPAGTAGAGAARRVRPPGAPLGGRGAAARPAGDPRRAVRRPRRPLSGRAGDLDRPDDRLGRHSGHRRHRRRAA